jgi:CheY-like chemotaxis protein
VAARCLIVDDNEPFLEVVRVHLEREGLSVAAVAASPAAGFLPKTEVSAKAIRRIVDGRAG